jgi:hypothetical protein
MRYPEPSDKDNTFPRYLCITSIQITTTKPVIREKRVIEKKCLGFIVCYDTGVKFYFDTMLSAADYLGVSYDVVKVHLFKRKHGIDMVSKDQYGKKFRIYKET